jgi:uncharacterized protein (DUF952 family)
MTETLYRILSQANWEKALVRGHMVQSESDVRDGFIHLSTEETYVESANRYFQPEDRPLALILNPAMLKGEIRWVDVASRGARFPHLYASEIAIGAVQSVVPLESNSEGFVPGALESFSPVS